VSISALAAAAFSSTSAMAQLLGESEFTVLFHEGAKQSIHVSTVGDEAILLAIFDDRTTVGMVRLFAKESSAALAEVSPPPVRVESRGRVRRTARGRGRATALDAPTTVNP